MSITGATVTLEKKQLTYSGSEQAVKVTGVTADGVNLSETDYEVSGNTGTYPGKYTVTVTGKGNCTGSATAEWSIVDKAITVSAPDVNVPYDGQPHGIIVTVIDPAVGAIVAYGTSEGTCDLPESPTITDVGTLTVYYQVTAAKTKKVTFKILPKPVKDKKVKVDNKMRTLRSESSGTVKKRLR